MSEAPRWGRGGLCSNRLDEFSLIVTTAEALNRPEFLGGSRGPGQIATGVPPDGDLGPIVNGHTGRVVSVTGATD
jgi:hypothetical protein